MLRIITLVLALWFSSNSFALSIFGPAFIDVNETARIKVYIANDKPSGTVILIPGSDGWNGIGYPRWITLINDWGYNVVLMDLFNKRGFTEIPSQGHLISFKERAKDIDDTANYITKQTWATNNVSLIGFSQGGATVLAVSKYITNPSIKAGVALYPSCYYVKPNFVPNIPVVLHIGMQDDWARPEYCGDEMNGFTVYKHSNATHAFDIQRGPRVIHGYNLRFDSSAYETAKEDSKRLFDRMLNNTSK
jgi:dienelactone hydrolase